MKRLFYLILSLGILCPPVYAEETHAWLEEAYQAIKSSYIKEISLNDVVMPVLQKLQVLDNNIKISSGRETVTIYHNGRMYKTVKKPITEEPRVWADFTTHVVRECANISPKIKLRDFDVFDILMYNGLPVFDANAGYRSDFVDAAADDNIIRIQTYADKMYGSFLYVRLGMLNEYTVSELKKSLARHTDIKGLLLDLRGNQGGYLQSGLEVADMFVDKGVLLATSGRDENIYKYYRAHEGDVLNGLPITILVDARTASAAEALAVALRDHGRAKIVGAQSYGKSSVQNLFRLSNGGSLFLTTEVFYSPSGQQIDTVGIRPNVCSEIFGEDSNIDELLDYTYDFICPKFSRDSSFDLKVALRLLERKNEHSN